MKFYMLVYSLKRNFSFSVLCAVTTDILNEPLPENLNSSPFVTGDKSRHLVPKRTAAFSSVFLVPQVLVSHDGQKEQIFAAKESSVNYCHRCSSKEIQCLANRTHRVKLGANAVPERGTLN